MRKILVATILWSSALFATAPEPKRGIATVDGPPKYELNHAIGTAWAFRGPAYVVGTQFGFRVLKTRFFWGPDLSYALFADGGLFSVLGSVWWNIDIGVRSSWTFRPGMLGGVGFTRHLPNTAPTLSMLLADLVLSTDLDDLATFRLQVRPGLAGREPILFVNANLAFRFY